MPEYIEEFDNVLGQVFWEFSSFLYLCYNDFKSNEMLHSILKTSERIHVRNLVCFFSDSKKQSDDLIYLDILKETKPLNIDISQELKIFLNKNTAHLSKKRGKLIYPDDEYIEVKKSLVKTIYRFISELDNGNINSEYKKQVNNKTVNRIKSGVLFHIIQIKSINDKRGVRLEL